MKAIEKFIINNVTKGVTGVSEMGLYEQGFDSEKIDTTIRELINKEIISISGWWNHRVFVRNRWGFDECERLLQQKNFNIMFQNEIEQFKIRMQDFDNMGFLNFCYGILKDDYKVKMRKMSEFNDDFLEEFLKHNICEAYYYEGKLLVKDSEGVVKYISEKETKLLFERIKNLRFCIKNTLTKEISKDLYTGRLSNWLCNYTNNAYGMTHEYKVLALNINDVSHWLKYAAVREDERLYKEFCDKIIETLDNKEATEEEKNFANKLLCDSFDYIYDMRMRDEIEQFCSDCKKAKKTNIIITSDSAIVVINGKQGKSFNLDVYKELAEMAE